MPELPLEGVPFSAFYLKRLGSITSVRIRQAQIREAASAVGIDIAFDRIKRVPNTAQAHQLFKTALTVGRPEQCEMLLERLFSAYFHNSENLGDDAVLSQILMECDFTTEVMHHAQDSLAQPFQSANIGGNGCLTLFLMVVQS